MAVELHHFRPRSAPVADHAAHHLRPKKERIATPAPVPEMYSFAERAQGPGRTRPSPATISSRRRRRISADDLDFDEDHFLRTCVATSCSTPAERKYAVPLVSSAMASVTRRASGGYRRDHMAMGMAVKPDGRSRSDPVAAPHGPGQSPPAGHPLHPPLP